MDKQPSVKTLRKMLEQDAVENLLKEVENDLSNLDDEMFVKQFTGEYGNDTV